jgi:hypothetical protein
MPSSEQQMATLLDMGFGNNRAVRALQATGFKVRFGYADNDNIAGGRGGHGVAPLPGGGRLAG